MKKLLLILFSIVISVRVIYANPILFSIQKKSTENVFYRYLTFNGCVFLSYCQLNDIQGHSLGVTCHSENETKQAKIALTGLVNDLMKEGYKDCLIKSNKTNEYIFCDTIKINDGYGNIPEVYILITDNLIKNIYMSHKNIYMGHGTKQKQYD